MFKAEEALAIIGGHVDEEDYFVMSILRLKMRFSEKRFQVGLS